MKEPFMKLNRFDIAVLRWAYRGIYVNFEDFVRPNGSFMDDEMKESFGKLLFNGLIADGENPQKTIKGFWLCFRNKI